MNIPIEVIKEFESLCKKVELINNTNIELVMRDTNSRPLCIINSFTERPFKVVENNQFDKQFFLYNKSDKSAKHHFYTHFDDYNKMCGNYSSFTDFMQMVHKNQINNDVYDDVFIDSIGVYKMYGQIVKERFKIFDVIFENK
jgi:hypothetical protein